MFESLRRRLLLAYLLTMSVIFSASGMVFYSIVYRSLEQQLNEDLQALAHTAIPSLTLAKTKGFQALDQELPWRELMENDQGLEWFDANGNLLATEGSTFPNIPFPKESLSGSHLGERRPIIQEDSTVRSLSVAIYAEDISQKSLRLEGYIRASESIDEWQIRNLHLGLGIGGVTVLVLSSISGIGLTWFASKPLKESFGRLKEFSHDAAHELRSPLTAITLAAEVMQLSSEQLSAADAKKVEIIVSAAQQITRLVEDLRFLAQTDAAIANSGVEFSPIFLDKLLECLVARFEAQADVKDINFESHLIRGICVKGDPDQLSRLYTNLLQNAFKYTPEGGKVSLRLERQKRFAVVRVDDTGIGIAQEYLPYVFQRFWRSDKVKLQQAEGLGLGLAIAQAIAHRHQGEIKVTSKLGIGSSFQVYLPLQGACDPELAADLECL